MTNSYGKLSYSGSTSALSNSLWFTFVNVNFTFLYRIGIILAQTVSVSVSATRVNTVIRC